MRSPKASESLPIVRPSAPRRLRWLLLVSGAAVLAWSGIEPTDRFTWALEVAPAVIAGGVLIATGRRFPFSTLACVLIWTHALILMIGGHWTYAQVPWFNQLKDAFDLSRNYYDRVGHVAQGFIPAIIVREVLLRTSPLKRGKWLAVIVVAFCLAVSAAYELLEWAVAVVTAEAAESFLATQGDVWDTQWDMFLAFSGAIAALALLSRAHDRSMRTSLPASAQPAGG